MKKDFMKKEAESESVKATGQNKRNVKSDSREIAFNIDGVTRRVLRSAYVTAKTKQLREFGYPSLTEEEVSKQLDAVLAEKPLTVIGHFMKDEVILS